MITSDQLKDAQGRTEALYRYLDIEAKTMELQEEQLRTQDPGFWDDAEDAAYCHTCGALSEEHLRKTIHAMNAF